MKLACACLLAINLVLVVVSLRLFLNKGFDPIIPINIGMILFNFGWCAVFWPRAGRP